MLFVDGSSDPKSKIGFGAYLFISEFPYSTDLLKERVKLKQFIKTSSSTLELQTLLWALSEVTPNENGIVIYTDSQNIISLLGRRKRLEKGNFSSKKNHLIKNHLLYKDFYKLIDNLNCEFVKVAGHKRSDFKSDIDKLFTLVDKASRSALRKLNSRESK